MMKNQPDFAIIAANPIVFKHIVLPPVLGPVITRTLVPWPIKKSTGTGLLFSNAVTWQSRRVHDHVTRSYL